MDNQFGINFKNIRKYRGYTLRKFCVESNIDVGDQSQMERGLLPPPSNIEELRALTKVLNIPEDGVEFIVLKVCAESYYCDQIKEKYKYKRRFLMKIKVILEFSGDVSTDEEMIELAKECIIVGSSDYLCEAKILSIIKIEEES